MAIMIDKFGNIYYSQYYSLGASVGIPINVTVGFVRNGVGDTGVAYRDYIQGIYGTVAAAAIVGGTIGITSDFNPVIELTASPEVSLSATVGVTKYIGSIYNIL